MPASLYRAIACVALCLAVDCSLRQASAVEPDFSSTSEVERRFPSSELDALPEVQSVLEAALSLTRHALIRRDDSPEATHTTSRIRFDWARNAPRSVAWRNAHLEDDDDSGSFDKPTMVEAMIAQGFPEGQPSSVPVPFDRWQEEPSHSLDVPTQPSANHLATYSRRSSSPKVHIAIEGVAARFSDEGASSYR